MTFLNSSHVHFPYGSYWTNPKEVKRLGFIPETFEADREKVLSAKKTRGIFWLVSNCKTASKREEAVEELARHIRVDIAGNCSRSHVTRNLCPHGSNCDSVYNAYY